MAYFKRSMSDNANYVQEGKRFKPVISGYGTHILIFTAQDRQKQQARRELYYDYGDPLVVAIHGNPCTTYIDQHVWDKDDICFFWRYWQYDIDQMEAWLYKCIQDVHKIQAQCFVTSLYQHGKLTAEEAWPRMKQDRRAIAIAGRNYLAEARMSGKVQYAKVMLAWRQMRVHNIKLAVKAYKETWF